MVLSLAAVQDHLMIPARKRILIVEDDNDIRENLKDFLEIEGHSVLTATNGKEGLEALEKSPKPDLILLDLMMPIMNGFEFAEHLKANKLFHEVPIIIMSADNQCEKKVAILGIKNIIKKPFELNDLIDLVGRTL